MKEEHILISSDGPDCNVLKFKPPMVFTKENVDELIVTLDRILKEVREITESSIPVMQNTVHSSKSIGKGSITIKKPIKEEQIKSI